MTVKEKVKIKQAIDYLMADECEFEKALDILMRLLGYSYAPANIKITSKSIHSVFAEFAKTKTTEDL